MQLGMVGLGRMGANIVRRLMRDGHTCVVYDVSPDAVATLVAEGATGADSLDDFVAKLDVPRRAWIMVPAGEITESTVEELASRLERGRHDHRRRQLLLPRRHPPRARARGEGDPLPRLRHERRRLRSRSRLLPDGRRPRRRVRRGSSRSSRRSRPASTPRSERRDAAGEPDSEERGYLHCGPSGAGHFVKMVHNGIEYGMMAALAEGLNILHGADAGLRQRDRDAETAPLDHPEFYAYDARHPRDHRGLAARQRRRVVASRPHGCRAARVTGSRRLRGTRLRLGRGALDGDRSDRGGRAGRRADRRPVLTVLVTRRGALRQQGALGDAATVRRPSREARLASASPQHTASGLRGARLPRSRRARRPRGLRGPHRRRPGRR